MKSKLFGCIPLLLMLVAICVGNAFGTIDPDHLEATLNPGECITETKTVFLPGVIPCADIIFAFDCTGSMSPDLDVSGTEAINIMNALTPALISDARFGVMSFRDYPGYYTSCGYSSTYGGATDYAYRLDQALTDDKTLVSSAINGLSASGGADGPESYTRPMYESYSDPEVVWRSGCKRILIMFGDNVPHDCELMEDCDTGSWPTGVDPGRDEVAMTGDDLDLQTVLAEMTSNQITLLFVANRMSPTDLSFLLWECWTAQTGGDAWLVSAASDIPDAIEALVGAEAAHIDRLTLESTCGDWLTSVVPSEYTDIDIPPEGTSREFEVTICVPPDTPICTTYTCEIWASGDGVDYGRQTVEIKCGEITEEHDVEAVSQTAVKTSVEPGTPVDIVVTVRNNGAFTETFDVTCYFDSEVIGTETVVDLAPGATTTVTFTWDTTGVPVNGYSIKAHADSANVIVEVDEDNNWCEMPLPVFVIPEVPLGTVATLLSTLIALVGFIGFKRFRPSQLHARAE